MLERRQYIRIHEEDELTYTVLPVYKTQRKVTEDISQGGIRFMSDTFISVRAFLRMEISLRHAARVIDVVAQVRWVRAVYDNERYEVGVQFIEIAKDDLQFLIAYIVQRKAA
jgi:c-di-GMP-binding flagellar brake protein YcgR